MGWPSFALTTPGRLLPVDVSIGIAYGREIGMSDAAIAAVLRLTPAELKKHGKPPKEPYRLPEAAQAMNVATTRVARLSKPRNADAALQR